MIILLCVLAACLALTAMPDNFRKGTLIAGAVVCIVLLADLWYASHNGQGVLFSWMERR